MKIFNLFPLTIAEDSIEMSDIEREKLVEEIKKMKADKSFLKETDLGHLKPAIFL